MTTPITEPLAGLAERLREVTQADRDAAADRLMYGHLSDRVNSPVERTADKIRSGGFDGHPWVQAFAQHRATVLEEQSRRVEELEAALRPFALEADAQDRVTSFVSGEAVIPRTRITIGALRRARTALSADVEKGEGA